MYRLVDVAVVDPRDGTIAAHRDVHIADGRITDVTATAGPADNATARGTNGASGPIGTAEGRAGDADDVDGRGRFVVPGYVDMHAHPLNLDDPGRELGLMLAFGITGYRQMSGTPELLRRRRADDHGRRPTDNRGTATSGDQRRYVDDDRTPALLATCGSVLMPMNAGRVEQAVEEVRRQARDGADFIKAAMITPEVYFAVQREADRLGIPVVGHLPGGIDVRAASAAGFKSIEHVGPGLGILAGCTCHEEHLRAAAPAFKVPPIKMPFAEKFADKLAGAALRKLVINPAQRTTPAVLRATREAIDEFDEGRARELARRFAADGTWNCPTLIRVKAQLLCDDPAFAADPDLRYVTAAERTDWSRAAAAFRRKFDEAQRAVFAEQFALQQRVVRILDEEGAPLLTGTDAVGAAWVVAGASLHDEFDLLAEAGLTPSRILRAATADAARFLGRERDAGTVEAGKEADLLLLDGDPTASMAGLHGISGVVRAGRHYDGAALAALRTSA